MTVQERIDQFRVPNDVKVSNQVLRDRERRFKNSSMNLEDFLKQVATRKFNRENNIKVNYDMYKNSPDEVISREALARRKHVHLKSKLTLEEFMNRPKKTGKGPRIDASIYLLQDEKESDMARATLLNRRFRHKHSGKTLNRFLGELEFFKEYQIETREQRAISTEGSNYAFEGEEKLLASTLRCREQSHIKSGLSLEEFMSKLKKSKKRVGVKYE